jgi:DNA polymerase-3 subunit gamma/tau
MRDAISLLDRCIGISSDVTAEVVRAAAGLAAQGQLFEIANCTINKNVKRALEIIDALYKDSKDMASLCEELQSHFRSLMLIKTVSKPRELVVMSDREFDAAVAEAAYLSLPDILYDMDVLARARSAMRDSVSPRTELEMALVKLCAPELDQTDEALFARVTALEKAVKLLQNAPATPAGVVAPIPQAAPVTAVQMTAPVQTNPEPVQPTPEPITESESDQSKTDREEAPAPQPEEVKQPDPVPEQKPVEAVQPVPPEPQPAQSVSASEPKQQAPAQPAVPQRQKIDMEALYYNAKPFEMWQDVVSNLRHYSRAIAAAFEDTNAYVSGDYLLIETNHEIAFELLKKSAQREEIRKAVQEITGKVYKLGPYKLPEKKVSKDDVLDNFINRLKSSGVNVTEE